MKTSICIFKFIFIFFLTADLGLAVGQNDSSTFFTRTLPDTSGKKMNMDAVYNRPFLNAGKLPVAIGGYLEANTQYESTDGVSEGLSFQARRLTLFLSSTIAKRIKFLSEVEFEEGGHEVNIEFAAMDIEFHPLVNLRGGIIMNPIGAFNQNHDGPMWDFVDRPISATAVIPSTLSNAGFGLHGKYYTGRWILGYETYLTNGFDDHIINNVENRTSLAAGKLNPERFEESNSGKPMFTGKVAVRNRNIGEFGISYMGGVYNKWQEDGVKIDSERSVKVWAFDYSTSLLKDRLNIRGEIANVKVEVPENYTQQYGEQQFGGYIDIIATVLKRSMLDWENAKLNVGVRLEYADFNEGNFMETGENIAEDIWAVVPTIAFRPAGPTVLRFNYRYQEQRDIFGNPPSVTGVIQFGFATYF